MKNNKEKFKKDFRARIYQFILTSLKSFEKLPDRGIVGIIKNQFVRSVTSIGANYIEAQAGSSKKDFINFFHHSLKSANESRFWLILLRDLDKGDKKVLESLLQELTEISNILASSLLTMKGKK